MSVPNGYSNLNLKSDALEQLRDFTRQLAAKEHKRVTLSEALVRAIKKYQDSERLENANR